MLPAGFPSVSMVPKSKPWGHAMHGHSRILLLALGLSALAGSAATSQQASKSPCNFGAANTPAREAGRGGRAEGWLLHGPVAVVRRKSRVPTSPAPAAPG